MSKLHALRWRRELSQPGNRRLLETVLNKTQYFLKICWVCRDIRRVQDHVHFCFPFPVSHSDASASYIRQLENQVRMLEEENKQLLSQVTTAIVMPCTYHFTQRKPHQWMDAAPLWKGNTGLTLFEVWSVQWWKDSLLSALSFWWSMLQLTWWRQ